ncbi:MAG: hypothetical protein II748_02550 [Clostridia bacterium]|nr:hypothetical protein [Clostridia bacterium]
MEMMISNDQVIHEGENGQFVKKVQEDKPKSERGKTQVEKSEYKTAIVIGKEVRFRKVEPKQKSKSVKEDVPNDSASQKSVEQPKSHNLEWEKSISGKTKQDLKKEKL